MFRIGDRVKVNAPSLKSHGVCGIATSNPGDLISGLTTVRLDNGQNISIKDSKLLPVVDLKTSSRSFATPRSWSFVSELLEDSLDEETTMNLALSMKLVIIFR